jgi:hypothetical protein
VARCTVERLMQAMGIKGVVRGRRIVTTNPDAARPCPDDKVIRRRRLDSHDGFVVAEPPSPAVTGLVRKPACRNAC